MGVVISPYAVAGASRMCSSRFPDPRAPSIGEFRKHLSGACKTHRHTRAVLSKRSVLFLPLEKGEGRERIAAHVYCVDFFPGTIDVARGRTCSCQTRIHCCSSRLKRTTSQLFQAISWLVELGLFLLPLNLILRTNTTAKKMRAGRLFASLRCVIEREFSIKNYHLPRYDSAR